MKPSNSYLLTGIALVLGIAIGHLTTGVSEPDRGQGGRPERAENARFSGRAPRESQVSVTGHQRLHHEIRRASPDQIPSLVYRVLEIADPSERKSALFEAIRAADPDQCQAIMDQFVKITRETGRLQSEIWTAALFETGKIGGTELLDSWITRGKNGDNKELCESIYGFATQDPRGALDWLNKEENTDLAHRNNLMGFVIAGVALTNVAEAARMMGELPIEQRRQCIGHFMWNAIQNEGIDTAIDWAIAESTRAVESEPSYAQALENDVFERLYTAAEWTGGAPQMADRFARIHEISPISSDRIVNAAQRLHGSDGLTFIDKLATDQVVAADDPEVTVRAVQQIVSRSPDVARQWLLNHPDSPLRDLLENGASRDLNER